MFDILVYLFENYFTPEACPDPDTLARKLAAAGFEDDEIDDALTWLSGLAESTSRCVDLALVPSHGHRVYADAEYRLLGSEAIGFVAFLESAGVLSSPLREIVVDRASALGDSPVPLEKLKIIVLMVLWSQETEIDNLILEELLEDGSARQIH
jgi:Smg protein